MLPIPPIIRCAWWSCSVSALLRDTAEGDMVRFVSSLLSSLHQYVYVIGVCVCVCVCACVCVCVLRTCMRKCYVYDLPPWFHVFAASYIYIYIYMLSSIVKDATTYELEFCGHKQVTAQAHVRPHCVWLNFEHTKKSNPSNNIPRIRNSNSNLLINCKNHPKSFEFISVRMVMRCGFLTVDPLILVSMFIAKLSQR